MIRAVIFDMDGVLINAREWHYEALNRALALIGFEITRFDHLSSYDGLPTRRKLEMLTIVRGLPRELHEFLGDLKQRYTMELVHTRCKPIFQQEFAVSQLKGDGYRLAVASNSVRSSVEAMLSRSNLLPYFDEVLSNEDVDIGKPDPAIYAAAMSRLSVTSAETLIVEDNEHGVAAARASGAHVMVVDSPDAVALDAIRDHIAAAEAAHA
jgi:HAD superfamily hydrolase (TIGR01509 family)